MLTVKMQISLPLCLKGHKFVSFLLKMIRSELVHQLIGWNGPPKIEAQDFIAGLVLQTWRLAQSMIATRYKKPRWTGNGVRSAFALLLPEPYVRLSAHTALRSSLAHGHSNITVARSDGRPDFIPNDVRIDLRVPPSELPFGTCY